MKGATSSKFPCHNNAKKIYSDLEQRVHVVLLANWCRVNCSINSIIGNHPKKIIKMRWLIRRHCRARVLILCIYSLLQNATPKNCSWLSHFYDIKSKNHGCTHNQPTLTPFKDIPLQSCFCCTFTPVEDFAYLRRPILKVASSGQDEWKYHCAAFFYDQMPGRSSIRWTDYAGRLRDGLSQVDQVRHHDRCWMMLDVSKEAMTLVIVFYTQLGIFWLCLTCQKVFLIVFLISIFDPTKSLNTSIIPRIFVLRKTEPQNDIHLLHQCSHTSQTTGPPH